MTGRRLRVAARLGIGVALVSLAVVFIKIGAVSAQDRTADVDRGRYLVNAVAACGQCHTPRSGASEDPSRYMSGHPASGAAPKFSMELMQQGVFISISPMYTAFSGPWGVSFSTNLTPDAETGLGSWTEEQFVLAMRTGKHLGQANRRPILPPMPWKHYQALSDADLRAIWSYLRTVTPISNSVPEARNRFGNAYE